MRLYDKKISKKDKKNFHELMRHFQIQAQISKDKDAYYVLKVYNDELTSLLPKIKETLNL